MPIFVKGLRSISRFSLKSISLTNPSFSLTAAISFSPSSTLTSSYLPKGITTSAKSETAFSIFSGDLRFLSAIKTDAAVMPAIRMNNPTKATPIYLLLSIPVFSLIGFHLPSVKCIFLLQQFNCYPVKHHRQHYIKEYAHCRYQKRSCF